MTSSDRRHTRVLVTGGCGFIGRALTSSLRQRGHPVRVLDDLSAGVPELSPGVELVVGDVLDRAAVGRAAAGVDLIVHLAGLVGMRLATSYALAAYQVATAGTESVLAAAGDRPVALFSSSAVYGLAPGPMREWDPIAREAPLRYDGGSEGYATGKWEMERIGARHAATGRKVLVIRPFNVVGPGQSARYGMVLPTFARQAVGGQPMTVFGDGSQRRCFSDVTEFIRLVLHLLAAPERWPDVDPVVNIGSTEQVEIGTLARLVRSEAGSESQIVFMPYESQFPGRTDVQSRVPSIERLEALAGPARWAPIASIVRDVVAAQRRTGGQDGWTGGIGGTGAAGEPHGGHHGLPPRMGQRAEPGRVEAGGPTT